MSDFPRDTSSLFSDSDEPESTDPIASDIEWSPLISGGANFRTHRLKKVGYHMFKSVPTAGYIIFISVFILVGAGCLVGVYFILRDSLMTALILGFMGVIFFGLGVSILIRSMKAFTIDLDLGVFYKGTYDPYAHQNGEHSGSIRDIYALQLLTERIKGSKSSYNSYEMNLVMKDGRRVNVMDHGSFQKVQEDATLLADALNIPVWNPPHFER